MPYPFEEGTRVRAKRVITEGGGDTLPDESLPFGKDNKGYVHAREGEMGTVVGVDVDQPTVRFDRTRTATIVNEDEVEEV